MMGIFLGDRSAPCVLCKSTVNKKNCRFSSCQCLFHRKCLSSWIKRVKDTEKCTCPNDQCSLRFTEIQVRQTIDGPVVKTICVQTLLHKQEKCPICFDSISGLTAQPESCNHFFCYPCLLEWTKKKHECPLDRKEFQLMLISDYPGGSIVRSEELLELSVQSLSDNHASDIQCEVCHLANQEELLLLCDSCNKAYHTFCLPIPLDNVPEGDWFCGDCRAQSDVEDIHPELFDMEAQEHDLSSQNSDTDASDEVRGLRALHGELDDAEQQLAENAALSTHQGSLRLQVSINQWMNRIQTRRQARINRRQHMLRRDEQSADEENGSSPVQPRPKRRRRVLLSFSSSSSENDEPRAQSIESSNSDTSVSSSASTTATSSSESCNKTQTEELRSDDESLSAESFNPGVSITAPSSSVKRPARKVKKKAVRGKKKTKRRKKRRKNKRKTALAQILASTSAGKSSHGSNLPKLQNNCPSIPKSHDSLRLSFSTKLPSSGGATAAAGSTSKSCSKPAGDNFLSDLLNKQDEFLSPPKYKIPDSFLQQNPGPSTSAASTIVSQYFTPDPSSKPTPCSSSGSSRVRQQLSLLKEHEIKTILQETIKEFLDNGTINREECKEIYSRCCKKTIFKEDRNNVSTELLPRESSVNAVRKLAKEYVIYFKKNKC